MKMSKSCILLRSLRFHAFHGVLEQERTVGNDYEVSLRIRCGIEDAMLSDEIGDTINYAEVSALVAQEMRIPSKLLEHVAGRIGKRLFQCFPQIEELELHIIKVNPPMGADCDGAGIEIHLINDKTLEEI